jgi:gas vesicle protein
MWLFITIKTQRDKAWFKLLTWYLVCIKSSKGGLAWKYSLKAKESIMSENGGKKFNSKLGYFLVGTGIGAVVVLLFAPKAGRELRSDIVNTTHKGIDYAGDSALELGHRVAKVYKAGIEKASGIIEDGKGAIEERKEKIAAALEAGKKAYKERREEGKALAAGESS